MDTEIKQLDLFGAKNQDQQDQGDQIMHDLFMNDFSIPSLFEIPLPVMILVQPMSEYAGRAPMCGYAVVFDDGTEPVFAESVKVAPIDLDMPSRVMWQYDQQTGSRVMGDKNAKSTSPYCASNDGVTPRASYIGKQFRDPRTGAMVSIVENGCAYCALGKWQPQVDENGVVRMTDRYGKPAPAMSAPLCSLIPQFLLWVVSYTVGGVEKFLNIPVIFRVTSLMANRFVSGITANSDLYRNGVVASPRYGLAQYFRRSRLGGVPTMRFVDGEFCFFPLIMGTERITTRYNSRITVPIFSIADQPLKDGLLDQWKQALAHYRNNPSIRAQIMGKGDGMSVDVENGSTDSFSGGDDPASLLF